jgi:hypothetical protein
MTRKSQHTLQPTQVSTPSILHSQKRNQKQTATKGTIRQGGMMFGRRR